MENNPTVRGLQAILRRLKFLAPGIRTVRAPGVNPDVLDAALAKEDLSAADAADAEIYWQPGKRYEGTSSARAVAVVAAEVASHPLPHLPVERSAQTYIPLRDWVTGWFAEGSIGAKLLAPILVSPAVGDRPTRVPLKGNREWIFTSKPLDDGLAEERGYAFKMALVSGFGCGFFPLMPATLACVTMTPVALALYLVGGWTALFLVSTMTFLLSTIASVMLEKWAGRQLLAEDPREFVLDEYAGLALTWMFLPPGAPWWAVIAGFFLFRIFDIFKWGVHWVEDLPISGKIVWDDVLAGLYAGIALWVLCRLI